MTAARPRKKKGLKIWSPRTLALVGVFLVSMGIGTVGINASRESQLATALAPKTCGTVNPDCPDNVPGEWTYGCDYPGIDPKDKTKKTKCAKGKMCSTQAAGKTIAGKCQCPKTCLGNADEATDKNDPGKEKGDGKMPELPKMPEPKDSPPGGGQPSASTCKAGVAGGVDEKGQPCAETKDTRVACLLDSTAEGCTGADTTTEDTTTKETETTAETTPKSNSWTAIVTTWAEKATDAVQTTVNTVTNTVQEIGKSFGGNSTYGVGVTDVVKYVDSNGTQIPPQIPANGTPNQISAEVTGFGAQGNTGATANSNENSQVSPGFWGWAADQLQNFLNRF